MSNTRRLWHKTLDLTGLLSASSVTLLHLDAPMPVEVFWQQFPPRYRGRCRGSSRLPGSIGFITL
jgi:hypothetical protein